MKRMIIRNGLPVIIIKNNNSNSVKIISIKKGFAADHSSTSYEFYAIDQVLGSKEKAAVSGLSSRVDPTKRKASFFYHGEWSDLPGGWKPLMEKYYDVMWSESYGSWILAMAWNTDAVTIKKLKQFVVPGIDEWGINVYNKKDRVIISIDCHMGMDENIRNLIKLLKKNREYLMKGDYRLLKGIIERYGDEEIPHGLPERVEDDPKLPEETGALLLYIDFEDF